MNKEVYLDSANLTYINSEVLQEMMPVLTSQVGSVLASHSYANQSKELIAKARRRIAKAIDASSSEIYFANGMEEANNWAIIGSARANKDKGNHIIVSKTEDMSIIKACKQLEKEGFKISYVPVDENGFVKLNYLMHEIKKDTILVSIQIANGLIGTIQNLNAIARTVKEKDIVFHCDATYAMGNVRLTVKDIPIDVMTITSNKIFGPSGVACLFIKKGVMIEDYILGENKNDTKKTGMDNVASIVGFGKAVELVSTDVTINSQKLRSLREYFNKKVMENISNVYVVGHTHQRLSNISTLAFEFVDSQALATLLDIKGVAVSAYSASMFDGEPHYVLNALAMNSQLLNTVVRFSFAKNITKEDIDYVVEKLVESVEYLREISPLHISVVKKEEK